LEKPIFTTKAKKDQASKQINRRQEEKKHKANTKSIKVKKGETIKKIKKRSHRTRTKTGI
jgi:hypothetical protein